MTDEAICGAIAATCNKPAGHAGPHLMTRPGRRLPYEVARAALSAPAGLDWPTLANIIREVDGNHDLGAGELAARILSHPKAAALARSQEPTP